MVRMISPIVKRGAKVRTGKGFSIDEVKEAGVNVGEARHLGVPVDQRRSTNYPENVEALKEWIVEARKEGFRVPKPKMTSKGQRGRAFRGLTSSGKKMRALGKD
jgi:large subunit ribosomal protein L13e